MMFAGIVISAVAMFLGIFTKFPQGGGGLTNNLMVLSFFLPAPPLLPTPPPKRIPFDIEAAIAENEIYYIRNPVVAGNGTQGPSPRPRLMPSSAASNATAPSGAFKIPPFSFPAFSLPPQAIQFYLAIGETITTFAMVFLALCLPWLVSRQIHLLGRTGPTRKQLAIEFGELVTQIEHNCLFEDIKLVVSERNEAFAELRDTRKQARDARMKAAELDAAKEEELKGLRAERNDALEKLVKKEAELMKLEEQKEMEVDGLKKETKSQLKAWEEKEKKWKEQKAKEEKRNKEAIDSLNMGRERESESWKRQVEGLELEKKGMKEAFEAKQKNILGRMKTEREGWGKEKERLAVENEGEKAEKERLAAEKRGLEEKRVKEKEAWEKAGERAQRRIAELERALEDQAAEREREREEADAARKIGEEEKDREQRGSEERAKAEAKKAIIKLEEEVFNGRKLIEDLQSDERRDRQLLLELRAQLVRPTHPAPPDHMNPLRFGGSAPPPVTTAPAPPQFPRVNLPSFPPPPTASQLLPRPIVRLPPSGPQSRNQYFPAGPPASRSPPPNAPRGPRGSRRT